MSQKRMAVSLTVLELQRQKWTGGNFTPQAAGIRVKRTVYNRAIMDHSTASVQLTDCSRSRCRERKM